MIIFLITIILFGIAFVMAKKANLEIIIALSMLYMLVYIAFYIAFGIAYAYNYSPYNQKRMHIKQEFLQEHKDNEYLAEKILEWNTDILINQKYEKNKWIGFYIPNIYDNYSIIE